MSAASAVRPVAKVVPLPRRAKRGHQAARKSAMAHLDARVAQLEILFAALDQRIARGNFNRRFQISLAASILLHLVVIALVTFTVPDKSSVQNNQPMEVVLVNAKSKARPVKADVRAQNNLDGGGNTDADRRAKSPLPVLRDDPRSSDLVATQKRVEQLEQEARRLMAQAKSTTSVAAGQNQTAPQTQPQPDAPPVISQADVQRSLNVQRLEASIAKQWEAYQKRPRRAFIGARAEEYRYARYVEDWRVKIERIAELNYPQAAADRKIYGSLLLSVSIKANGAVEKIELRRSSGHKLLDEAAINIVKLGAPYAPFPPDIAKDTDIIDVIRTWRFTNTNQLQTE
jgi:periplasmic protein TonB